MNELLILVAVVSFCANAVFTRLFQVTFPQYHNFIKIYQGLFTLVSAIAFFGAGGFRGPFNGAILIYGALYGFFFYVTVLCAAIGYEKGSMSVTSIIENLSLLIPLLYSCFVLKEGITPVQIVGIVLILAVLIISSVNGEKEKQNYASMLWIIPVIIAFVTNGLTAVIQKHVVLQQGDSVNMSLMTTAYVVASLCFFINYFIVDKFSKNSGEEKADIKIFGKTCLMALPSGIGSWGGNALLGYLCTKVSGPILYPFLNGGLCIISALTSFVFFKEKITIKKIAVIVIGIVAIVILNM